MILKPNVVQIVVNYMGLGDIEYYNYGLCNIDEPGKEKVLSFFISDQLKV